MSCVAYRCSNKISSSNITFFKFPFSNEDRLQKWIQNINRKGWTPDQHSLLCSDHFTQDCFIYVGKRVYLHRRAVPTVFHPYCRLKYNVRRKRVSKNTKVKETTDESQPVLSTNISHCNSSSAVPTKLVQAITVKSDEPRIKETIETQQNIFSREKELDERLFSSLTTLGDDALERSVTVPSFFHSDYCLPKSICWDGDDDLNTIPDVNNGGPSNSCIIEITNKWEWLGLDIRGPFPITTHKHTHIMTVTDYHSKWVEAFPLTHNMIHDAAVSLADVIHQLGYPLAVLSRCPKQLLEKIKSELQTQGNVNTRFLVMHHYQTGYLDLVTESLLNKLICELVSKYADTWHIHLPAACLQLCCTEHPTTGKKPFTVMYNEGPLSLPTYRELPYNESDIRLGSFVISSVDASKGNTFKC